MARDIWEIEYTDTFGGEANYCWVNRAEISVLPQERDTVYTSASGAAKKRRAYALDVVRKAKAAMGLTGARGKSYWHGDSWEFRPYGCCTVLFATFKESA